MLPFLNKLVRGLAGTTPHRRSQALRRRLQFDVLEDRVVPALTGAEFPVNDSLPDSQAAPVTASSASGMSVVVWQFQSATAGPDIMARLFDAAGTPIGSDITVANSSLREVEHVVCMDAQGNFTVAWTLNNPDTTNGDIQFRRFDNTGTALDAVPIDAANELSNERRPSIAADPAGNFVITWTDFGIIRGATFLSDGTEVGAGLSIFNADFSKVDRNSSGKFVVAYVPLFVDDIQLQRFTADGLFEGAPKTIAHHMTEARNADVGLDDKGNAVVVYSKDVGVPVVEKLFARKLTTANDLKKAKPIGQSPDWELNPDIAMDRDSSSYVVTYDITDFTNDAVGIVEVKPKKKVKNFNLPVGTSAGDVSINAAGAYFIAYGRNTGLNAADIFGQRGTL